MWWLCAALGLALGLDLLRRALLPRRRFVDEHVIVTGGSAGIGKAIAKELLARGAKVTLLARTKAKLEQAVEELRPSCTGAAAIQYVCASTTSAAELAEAVAKATAAFGPVDSLVANAGGAAPGLFLEMPNETFESQMDLNYMGTVRSIKAVVPQMVERRRGRLIVVASGAAVVSFMGYSSYAPTKWALRGLADALRNELVGLGISVHVAYPPDTETPGFSHENETKPPETGARSPAPRPVVHARGPRQPRSRPRGRSLRAHEPLPPRPRPRHSATSAAAMVPVDLYPPDKVARSLLGGAESGLYHLPGPDPLLNWLVSSMAGVSPRAYPILECLTARAPPSSNHAHAPPLLPRPPLLYSHPERSPPTLSPYHRARSAPPYAQLPIAGLVETAACMYFDVYGRRYAARHSAEQLAAKKEG